VSNVSLFVVVIRGRGLVRHAKYSVRGGII